MNTYQYICAHGHILSDNGTEFKNSLLDQVLQHLGIDRIFSAPYHPQSNGKWEVFHKYLKPTLKKLCEKDQSNWDKYLYQVLHQLQSHTKLSYCWNTILLGIWQGPKSTFTSTIRTHAVFLGDPDAGLLNLETHRLTLAIVKKTLDENRFKMAQKTMDCTPPSFKIGDRVYFKNKQLRKWDLKWRPGYRIVCIEHDRHFLHIENQATGNVCSCNV